MILIADSGSTKTDWCVLGHNVQPQYLSTQGINPFQQDALHIKDILYTELLPLLPCPNSIREVWFYGAGCREEMQPLMQQLLTSVLPLANTIAVNTDLLAAARALYGHQQGIACILGTGANSCFYDGEKIIENVSPLGYILGDEGSGAVLGRIFINAMFKGGLPDSVKQDFMLHTQLSLADIINKVYKQPMANRFLASLSLYIHEHLDNADIRKIVTQNFRDFFRNNIRLYHQSQCNIGAIGSMAYYYQEQLKEAAYAEGFEVKKIFKSPMEGLIAFHQQE